MGNKTIQRTFFALLGLSFILTPTNSVLSKAMVENSKKMVKNMCVNRSGVDSATLAKMKSGEFPEDRKLQCYISCCLQYMKVMNKDKVTYEAGLKQINTQLPADIRPPIVEALEACKNVGGKDACEIGYNYAVCAYKREDSKTLVVPS